MSNPFWYIIANPAAGNGAVARQWPEIEELLQELGFSYSIKFTDSRGHAVRLVEDAILKGHRHLLGIGGDGTNHEIVNGIMQQDRIPSTDLHYALLPIGTGNDWARMYGIPSDPRQRLLRLLEGNTVWQDVGLVLYWQEGQAAARYFANVAGMAYDAYIARQLDRHRMVSRLQYLLMVGRYLFKYRLRHARLLFNEQVVEDHFYTINIGVCRYSGG
ncbi:MAG: hypothetical protein IT260_14365, partial [Saprospiraceae bacterium]|nr:hypothetical protein [Saprospiraceae bacterium]